VGGVSDNLRAVECEACEGSGRHEMRFFFSNDPEDLWDIGPCPACNGTGEEWIEVAPIEMEDLP
jgi:DnaJ-class molecular chaperone